MGFGPLPADVAPPALEEDEPRLFRIVQQWFGLGQKERKITYPEDEPEEEPEEPEEPDEPDDPDDPDEEPLDDEPPLLPPRPPLLPPPLRLYRFSNVERSEWPSCDRWLNATSFVLGTATAAAPIHWPAAVMAMVTLDHFMSRDGCVESEIGYQN